MPRRPSPWPRTGGPFLVQHLRGSYSEGTSPPPLEGLKDKTQTSFETAYSLDKTYYEGGPSWLSAGSGPCSLAYEREEGTEYLEEFHAMHPDNPEGLLYLGEATSTRRKRQRQRMSFPRLPHRTRSSSGSGDPGKPVGKDREKAEIRAGRPSLRLPRGPFLKTFQ